MRVWSLEPRAELLSNSGGDAANSYGRHHRRHIDVAAVGEWLYDRGKRYRLRETWMTPHSYTATEVDSFRNTCETLPA
jgi:hypothetical protein